MDAISEILSTLNIEDKKEFVRFVERSSSKRQDLVLKLFSIFKSQKSDKQNIMFVLYGKANYEAYKALRKRLLILLQQFVSLKLINSDSSNTAFVISTINMARYLYGHQKTDLAFKYLQKAEKQAIDNELLELLNSIYLLQIEYGNHLDENAIDGIIRKWERNKERLNVSEKIELAIQLISRNVGTGKVDDSNSYSQLINSLNANESMLNEPRFVYQLASLYRKQLMMQKDFKGLKEFLEKHFENVSSNKSTIQKGNYYLAALQYMMAHIDYRNKNFERSLIRTRMLGEQIAALPSTRKKEFEVKYHLLLAANQLYSGDIDQAVNTLEKSESLLSFITDEKAEINRKVNLSVVLALKGEYRSSKLLLLKIQRSDLWLIRKFGEEWLLKKSIIDALLYYELNDVSLLDSKLRFIKTRFRSLLKHPIYSRALVFVKFIEKIDKLDSGALESMVDQSFDFQPIEQEDLQAMTFYAWLKSKWVGQKPYDVLLGLLNIKT